MATVTYCKAISSLRRVRLIEILCIVFGRPIIIYLNKIEGGIR